MPFVEVAVNSGLPHRQTFSYAVPPEMTLVAGDAVFVPFGRRFLQGIVMGVVEVPAFANPKPVDARIGDQPVVSAERVELAGWLAEYYLSPLFAAVAPMLPPGFERKPQTFYEPLITADELASTKLPPRQQAVLSYLIGAGERREAKEIERDFTHGETGKLADGTRVTGVVTALSQLAQRGLVQRSYGLARPSVRAKTARYVYLLVPPEQAREASEALAAQRKKRLATALTHLAASGQRMLASELRMRAGVGLPDLRPLAEQGLIEVREDQVERDPLAGRFYDTRPVAELTPEQTEAANAVCAAIDAASGESFLLHGVTGSGKTEVYLAALDHAVAQGKRGIVLVPEIALTPQTVRRFAERFAGQVAVLHSGLSQGELYDQWHGIRDGRYNVVVGSRSAVFAPQPNLGLIVIDEEHEWTYKQQDQSPRYHARETAEQLAKLTGAALVLGSATPDVVSYQNALWGRHRLLELKDRVRPVIDDTGKVVSISTSPDLPPVDVVDMREELKGGNRSVFSRSLQLGLFQVLDRNEQAILFLNRRGTAGFVQCRDCGYVPQCSACAIAMGFHRRMHPEGFAIERLLCHQCNRGRPMFDRCPTCGSARLRPMGLGVEAVEDEVHALFPEARTLRWDRDVTQGRHSHEQILAEFMEGKADVLIGTQMVAKGLDLPAVTLVGVISADIGLHIPDFRSGERTFQLLTQVAGRAGRVMILGRDGPPAGRVVIQTYTPDNYAIVAAAQHDYASFFAEEVALRREQAYPPFTRLARLVFSHSNAAYGERQADAMAQELRTRISQRGLPGAEVLGPAPPHVPKWHGRFRWQVTVRSPNPVELVGDLTLAEGWLLDIDPASLA
ncbi:MAG TPA: primosomal protein N' [Dehalococcoidia bacterium]|nr:primosomal protein N' [Dehalococcoidia bacterium]